MAAHPATCRAGGVALRLDADGEDGGVVGARPELLEGLAELGGDGRTGVARRAVRVEEGDEVGATAEPTSVDGSATGVR